MPDRPGRLARWLLMVGLTTLIVACSAAGSRPSSPAVSGPAPTVEPSVPPVAGEVPSAIVAAVLAAVGEAAGQDAAGATIVEAVAVEWADGSLGCPEPGMLYTQVITPGYQVIVELDGQRFDARVAGEGAVIRLCEPGPAGG